MVRFLRRTAFIFSKTDKYKASLGKPLLLPGWNSFAPKVSRLAEPLWYVHTMSNLIHFLNRKFVSGELLISPRDLGYIRGYVVKDHIVTFNHKPFKVEDHEETFAKNDREAESSRVTMIFAASVSKRKNSLLVTVCWFIYSFNHKFY